MAGTVEAILQQQMAREAIASTALAHAESCCCRACRAAAGDEDAFLEVYVELRERDLLDCGEPSA